jgi:predicted HTH transcriptional regulator
LARTIAAFANGVGGSLWVGVTDSGEVIGVPDPRQVRLELKRVAAECVSPATTLRIERRRVDGLTLLVAHVPPASERPVRALGRDGRGRVYVRDGSSSRPAEPHTVRALGRPRTSRLSLDKDMRRILTILERDERLSLGDLARAARLGQRNARRAVVRLRDAGLVHGGQGRRLSLSPAGHRRLR